MWDFAISTVGTTLAIASANSINQYIEVDNDLMMKRTRNRMLPSGAMSLNHALAFGVITGVAGSAILAFGINMLASGLAFANIILYTLVYTPLKRVTPINTWIGAIVGAIPPLIGWVSKTGTLDAGAWVLFAALALWQIPHFLALSWPLRYDYRNAGYKMLSVTSPDQVGIQTLVYSVMMLGLGPAAWYYGMTSWPFIVDSSLLSLWLVYESWKFYQDNSNTSARRTFKVTLYWLPLFIMLMMVHLLHWDSDAEEEVEAAAVSEDFLLKAPAAALEDENVDTKQK
jgi:heme o synthase